jgi:RNA polymerase sigma factor (sigma-70 family)
MQKPRVFVVSADSKQEARKIAEERSPVSGCQIDVRETSRRNPYDVFADEPDVAAEQARRHRMMSEVGLTLPPTPEAVTVRPSSWPRQEFYQEDVGLFGTGKEVKPEDPRSFRRPTEKGRKEQFEQRMGVNPTDLAVVQALQDVEDEKNKLEIQQNFGIEVDEDDFNQVNEEIDELASDLTARGYGRREQQAAQARVWNAIKLYAYRAVHRTIGSRKDMDLDGITMEAAVKAFFNINKFQGGSKLSTWVWTIARSVATDALSKGRMPTMRGIPSGVSGLGGLGLGMTGVGKAKVDRASVLGGSTTETGEGVDLEWGALSPEDALLAVESDTVNFEDKVAALEALGVSAKHIQSLEAMNIPHLQEQKARDLAERAYSERTDMAAAQQDAAVEQAFETLSPEHQQILRLRSAKETFMLPDGEEYTSQGETPYSVLCRVLDIPQPTVGTRLKAAREALQAAAGVQPPFVGELTLAYLGLKRQGRPKLRKIRVQAIRSTPEEQAARQASRQADIDADFLERAEARLPRSKQKAHASETGLPDEMLEYLAQRPKETSWRRQNPMVGDFAYYESASDLTDLLLSGMITQAQHDEHLEALMAEEGVAL